MNVADLSAEFPREAISWRSQSLTAAGDKAMALAYIDARDVMDRLDTICGPAGWQDRYEFHGSRTICYLSIKVGDEWITKADGAGDSDVEAEKGAISDALKRAAVKWGIGRYLYAVDTPWVPCEHYEKGGKKHWKRWTVDPWSCVRGASRSVAAAPKPQEPLHVPDSTHLSAINSAGTTEALERAFAAAWKSTANPDDRKAFKAAYEPRKAVLLAPAKNLGEQLDRLQAEAGGPN